MKIWHTITLTFTGPSVSEYDTVNPFTDYRLDIEFTNGQQKIIVPGYFAADGNAAETSARSGNKWRAHFCPPADGSWNYKVSFLKGTNIAISDNVSGQKCFMDGENGVFTVDKTDKEAPDFRAKGRLQYTGAAYLTHAGSGEIFLKGKISPVMHTIFDTPLTSNDGQNSYWDTRSEDRRVGKKNR